MFYHLASVCASYISLCNVVHYVSFRAIAALITAFCMSLAFGQSFINYSKQMFQVGVRPFTPDSHKVKNSTPSMGGFFILVVVLLNLFLWCDWTKPEIWLFVLALSGYGAIGLVDDLCKAWYKQGIYPSQKMALQLIVAFIITISWIYSKNPSSQICLPFLKNVSPDLGYVFVAWIMFIIVGTSNAVNLTDGLDGLAIGSLLSNFVVFSIIAYFAGHSAFAAYLQIPFTGTGEVAVIGGILIGASLGFLWFNAHPAQIFMGDVGSLSLGAALALMAIVCKQELLLPLAGGMFVLEALSVIAQLISRKYCNVKLLKMAPFHHHFELIGWKEPKITVRFNIISLMLCLLALITLKIR